MNQNESKIKSLFNRNFLDRLLINDYTTYHKTLKKFQKRKEQVLDALSFEIYKEISINKFKIDQKTLEKFEELLKHEFNKNNNSIIRQEIGEIMNEPLKRILSKLDQKFNYEEIFDLIQYAEPSLKDSKENCYLDITTYGVTKDTYLRILQRIYDNYSDYQNLFEKIRIIKLKLEDQI
jgi:hypothetical protein